MEIKLFGKTLFSAKKEVQAQKAAFIEELITDSDSAKKSNESKFLHDFHKGDGGGSFDSVISEYIIVPTNNSGTTGVAIPKGQLAKKGKKKGETKMNIRITPKGVYQLKTLNDDAFQLNTNEPYIEKQISDFKNKLTLIKSEEYDMRNGVGEIKSVIMRLENRRKYAEVKEFYEQFPYTTTSKVMEMTKVHTHLKLGQIAQFIADMPAEATDVMKLYNEWTQKVCGKQAVFYIIADEKDFKKTTQRRDPILLAQSPFGHVWQILGAWDKEMMLIEEL